jgi:hypothetical protein
MNRTIYSLLLTAIAPLAACTTIYERHHLKCTEPAEPDAKVRAAKGGPAFDCIARARDQLLPRSRFGDGRSCPRVSDASGWFDRDAVDDLFGELTGDGNSEISVDSTTLRGQD